MHPPRNQGIPPRRLIASRTLTVGDFNLQVVNALEQLAGAALGIMVLLRHTMDADPHMVFKYRTLGVVGPVLDALMLFAPGVAPRVDQQHVDVVVPQVTDILRRHELFFKINWWASKPCITLEAAEADALLVSKEGRR